MISLAVVLYQVLFVAILYLASRFGTKALFIVMAASLVWTATHLFFPPLAVLQTCVIVASYFVFRSRAKARKQHAD
ncbi:MAG TPA: hypothetical protein VM576_11375 [Xanthomonadaceae bacterium]|nr:hypothetical protein [Xanthomonadaceae bacterium]